MCVFPQDTLDSDYLCIMRMKCRCHYGNNIQLGQNRDDKAKWKKKNEQGLPFSNFLRYIIICFYKLQQLPKMERIIRL